MEGKEYYNAYFVRITLLESYEVFDFDRQQWTLYGSVKELGIKGHCAVALPDGIYILGGFNDKEYLSTVNK